MIEPVTLAGTGMIALASKDLLTKLLGPTADYLGGEMAGFVDKCNINLNSIFTRSQRKLGKRIDEPGSVSPRVLKHIIDDGRFCEDDVVAEYYAGLLAGSREDTGKDDQSLPYLSKVGQMSAYQVRLHFAFYYYILTLHKKSDFNLGLGIDWQKAGLFIPEPILYKLFHTSDPIQHADRMTHSVVGLSSHGLINDYAYGEANDLKVHFPNAGRSGVYIEPNYTGAELFLWALGLKSPNGHRFFEAEISEAKQIMTVPDGAQKKN